jgi:hypothetical protein
MRSLSSDVLAAIQAEAGERVYLIKLDYSGGTIYLTTGSRDLSWDSQTWDAAGGALSIGTVEDAPDSRAGLQIAIGGVDQTVVGILLNQNYRGRLAQVWQAILDPDVGDVVGVIPLFEGFQLDNYEVTERAERGKPITCTITTRVLHRLATAEFRGIRANVHSHQKYYPNDTFFQHVASLASRKIYWGTTAPIVAGSGGGQEREGRDREGEGDDTTDRRPGY